MSREVTVADYIADFVCKELGVNTKKLAENLIQLFLVQAVRDGFFHGDMHQGNLFVDGQGNVIPVDFGILFLT